jgi:hypothetical protein
VLRAVQALSGCAALPTVLVSHGACQQRVRAVVTTHALSTERLAERPYDAIALMLADMRALGITEVGVRCVHVLDCDGVCARSVAYAHSRAHRDAI